MQTDGLLEGFVVFMTGVALPLIVREFDISGKRCGGDGAGFELTIDAAADPAVKPPGG